MLGSCRTETHWSTADTNRHIWNAVSEATRHSRRPRTATAEFWPKADRFAQDRDRESPCYLLPVHLALVDDQSNEVPSVRYPPQLANDAVLDVRPDDQAAATQVEEWLQAYATSRDPQLREQIILAHLGMADRLASRYRHSRGTTPEDLRQSARAGLIAAVDRYNPAYGNPFVPYAVACVVGELKRHLRDTSWRLHVPRPLKEQALRLCRAADELHQRLGRSPTTTEPAEHLGIG